MWVWIPFYGWLKVALLPTILAIAFPLVQSVARVIRANTLSLREQPFVEAARAIGMSDLRIAIRHILPNTLAPLIVIMTAQFGAAILIEAALSFLGLGDSRAAPLLGPDAVGIGGRICAHRAVAGDLPGRGDQLGRVRHEPVGRRAARYARSPATQLRHHRTDASWRAAWRQAARQSRRTTRR